MARNRVRTIRYHGHKVVIEFDREYGWWIAQIPAIISNRGFIALRHLRHLRQDIASVIEFSEWQAAGRPREVPEKWRTGVRTFTVMGS